jgi:hypothetical protein
LRTHRKTWRKTCVCPKSHMTLLDIEPGPLPLERPVANCLKAWGSHWNLRLVYIMCRHSFPAPTVHTVVNYGSCHLMLFAMRIVRTTVHSVGKIQVRVCVWVHVCVCVRACGCVRGCVGVRVPARARVCVRVCVCVCV